MLQLPNEIAPCGIYCGACPSFNKSCLGCASQSENQKRKSKWSCKIRICSYQGKQTICAACDDFPCSVHRKKLIDSHLGDPRFSYRHEVGVSIQKMNEMGIAAYLNFQKQRWSCQECGGQVWFYHYKCGSCKSDAIIQPIETDEALQ